MSRPAPSASSSRPASEISSLISGDDFSDRLLVSTSSPLARQDLVVQAQNLVNMAPAMPAEPSTIEPIVPIVAPLGAQGKPSVIQRARPVVSTEQTIQSTAVYGTLLYASPAMPYTALRHPCRTLPCLLCQQGLLTQWIIMVRAISSLLCLTPVGCLRERVDVTTSAPSGTAAV